METKSTTQSIEIRSKEIDHLININSFFEYNLYDQTRETYADLKTLKETLSPSLMELELSREYKIPIPKKVQDIFQQFRPTPLFRATNFEKAIGTNCEIYIKNEGVTPSGNHKVNSAYFIAALCHQDGIKTITTETTGNWGIAMALAAKEFNLHLICFIDSESNEKRPQCKLEMEKLGAEVIVVEQKEYSDTNLLMLSADAAIRYTKKLKNAKYIFGSIYGYFIVPQTIIGLEAKAQMAELDRYPDIVVGSCGGGANFLGTATAFLADHYAYRAATRFISAESELCPILSNGIPGLYSIDKQGYYPRIKTYGIPGIEQGDYIGGLGSTIVAAAVSELHKAKKIESRTYDYSTATKSAQLFRESEGLWVALETGYQLAAVKELAESESNKKILVNISAGKGDRTLWE